ncbi:4527_t:CDS:1, partial [Scutellospora calospora]
PPFPPYDEPNIFSNYSMIDVCIILKIKYPQKIKKERSTHNADQSNARDRDFDEQGFDRDQGFDDT